MGLVFDHGIYSSVCLIWWELKFISSLVAKSRALASSRLTSEMIVVESDACGVDSFKWAKA